MNEGKFWLTKNEPFFIRAVLKNQIILSTPYPHLLLIDNPSLRFKKVASGTDKYKKNKYHKYIYFLVIQIHD